MIEHRRSLSLLCNQSLCAMKTIVTLALFALLLHSVMLAQCELPETIRYLHGNAIRAAVTTGGDMFWDGRDAQFSLPTLEGQPSTIFAHELWLGGVSPGGTLKMAYQTYDRSRGRAAFYPGPLEAGAGAPSPEVCRQWDRIWSVKRYEIEAHLADFADNQVIDNPLPAIMGWPGRGNPYFEDLFGFPLPHDEPGLAPFADIDGDGIYNPLSGDYPAIEELAVLPEQLMWSVFNDLGAPWAEPSDMLGLEIQRTSWALRCSGDSPLNQTVFVRYRLINRTFEPIDSLTLGLWMDFDLGCFLDDYIGSAPEQDAFFVYNANPVDQSPCPQGVSPFLGDPPVQAVAMLSHPLTSFNYLGGMGGTPFVHREYFRLMNGLFADGNPIMEGGTGYQSGGSITPFAFHGDPNAPAQWSMFQEGFPLADYRCVGSAALGSLSAGEVVEVDLAYLFVREPGNNHLENVTAMYNQLEALRMGYADGFAVACQPPALCLDDCVWPGDANADGIANHADLLAIGLNLDATGPVREGFLSWAPFQADDWTVLGQKHADANGDGVVQVSDLLTLQLNYGQVRPDYVEMAAYPVGTELSASAVFPNGNQGLTAGSSMLTRISLAEVPGLKGLSFSLEYDPRLFDVPGGFFVSTDLFRLHAFDTARGHLDFAHYAAGDGAVISAAGAYEIFTMPVRAVLSQPVPSDTTYLRFKNVVAIREDGSHIPIGGMDMMATFQGVIISDAPEAQAPPLRLFPNPTDGVVKLDFPGQRVGWVAVLNAAGQQLRFWPGPFFDHCQLDLQALPAGVYFVRMERGGEAIMQKVVRR
jgi:hypothetical protein